MNQTIENIPAGVYDASGRVIHIIGFDGNTYFLAGLDNRSIYAGFKSKDDALSFADFGNLAISDRNNVVQYFRV